MFYDRKYQNISEVIKSIDYFEKHHENYKIKNAVITNFDIVVTGHFGNAVSMNMVCDCACPIPFYNSIQNIGYMLRALIELFDKEADESVNIKVLENTPIRIIYDNYKAIAIGHSTQDKFILIDELMHLEN